jgi:CheY-like chemotaxis protein
MKSRLSRSPAGPLAQQSILIVEDEPLVALDVHRVLSAAGASIISAATPGEAIKLLSFAEVTAAIVDLQLGSDDATLVCDFLQRRRIPFAFYTGRADTTLLHAQWPQVPLIKKPAKSEDIVSILTTLVASQVDR